MKWLFLGLGVAFTALICGIAALRRKLPEKTSEDVDGGVVKRYRTDMPKVIESTEIVSFQCVISLIAACEADGLGHRVYKLAAAVRDGEVLVKYDWRERGGKSDRAEYTAEADFMVRVQKIVSDYDLASQNGYYHNVSGLPDMYGGSLDIVYATDERIHIHDNQSGILPPEAEREFILLFGAATKLERE